MYTIGIKGIFLDLEYDLMLALEGLGKKDSPNNFQSKISHNVFKPLKIM